MPPDYILNMMIRLTRAQVREIDRRSIEVYHIPGIVLMENAARAVVDVACDMLRAANARTVLILCGTGNNGGDGFASARHLHNRGFEVEINLFGNPDSLRGDALTNFNIISRMNARGDAYIEPQRLDEHYSLIIDAIFGTGLDRPVTNPHFQRWAEQTRGSGVPILSVDVPSGLDCDTGQPLGPCFRAARTVTFVAEKTGFANPASKQYTGEITVGDIGCPRELIEEFARMTPP